MDKPLPTIRQIRINLGLKNLEKQKKKYEKYPNVTYDKMHSMINDATYDNMNTNETYDNDGVEYVEMTELKEEVKDDILNKDKSLSPALSYSHDDEDEDTPPQPYTQPFDDPQPFYDPFIARNLYAEISKVTNWFEVQSHGYHMAKFVIGLFEK
eukprot:191898_1